MSDDEGISNMDVAPEPYMDVLECVPLNRYAVLARLMVFKVFKQFAITNRSHKFKSLPQIQITPTG